MRYALCNNARNYVILSPFLSTIRMISVKWFDLSGFSLNMRALGGFILNLLFNSKWLCSLWGSKNQFIYSVVSNTLRPEGLQHTRLPCPSPTTGVCSNSCPLSWWCHPIISSSVVPFSSHLQSFQASGSFPMSQLFATGGQSIGISASASILPMNMQDWFPLGWTGWISLQSKGFSRVFSNTTSSKASILWHSAFFTTLTSIHDHWKKHGFD